MTKRITSSRKKEKKINVKKRKIKYKNVMIFLSVILVIVILIFLFLQLKITNIYVSNNYYLSEQEIIDIAGISNYPKSYQATSFSVKRKLTNNQMIKSVNVTKKMFTSIYIEVTENRPIFYDSNKSATVLLDGSTTENQYIVPTVINYIPDTVYYSFFENMILVDNDVLERISEIKYDPNDVDSERFLLFMDDGNYVYLTLDRFKSINNYLDIIKKFGSKKGILYLDSGEYFKILAE